MINIRKSKDRGHAHHDWLESFHTFSFASYYDPQYMHFHSLRVINEDFIQPGEGFGRHPHQDMEIITYVISGELKHQDSMGNGSIIKAGEIQKMSAGSGVEHSEFNASSTDVLHLLQIWIVPSKKNLTPDYEQYAIVKTNHQWTLLASPIKKEGVVFVHQQVELWGAYVNPNHELSFSLNQDPAWVQVVKGGLTVNGVSLSSGDGAAIEGDEHLVFKTKTEAEILLFRFLK